jgi:hypothetical protein
VETVPIFVFSVEQVVDGVADIIA